MIKQFTCRVTSFLVKENIVVTDDIEIYKYGLERLPKNLIVVLIISWLMIVYNTWVGTFFFFAGFIPLRRIAGGYHAKSSFKCNLITITIYIVNILFIYKTYYLLTYRFMLITSIISIILIFIFAPVDHKNFIFDSVRTIEAKNKSRKVIILFSFVSCLIMAVFNRTNIISLSITMGTFTAALSIVIGSIKRRGERNEHKPVSK